MIKAQAVVLSVILMYENLCYLWSSSTAICFDQFLYFIFLKNTYIFGHVLFGLITVRIQIYFFLI